MTVPNPAPKVGDKVAYVYDPARFGPQAPTWQERAERTSLVVDGPDGEGQFKCWSPADDYDWWFAPAERLRVVERATYTPVEEGHRS